MTRLVDLGVPAFEIATSITGILAQRLIRRLCACRKSIEATPEFFGRLLQLGAGKVPSREFVANGCEACDMTGYRGRIGIYELLPFDESIRGLVRDSGSPERVRAIARRNGMKLMHEYALEDVCEALTTLEEMLRVVPVEHVEARCCAKCGRELAATFAFCPSCGERSGSEQDGAAVPEIVLGKEGR